MTTRIYVFSLTLFFKWLSDETEVTVPSQLFLHALVLFLAALRMRCVGLTSSRNLARGERLWLPEWPPVHMHHEWRLLTEYVW